MQPYLVLAPIWLSCLICLVAADYRASPKLRGPSELAEDTVLNSLEAALSKVANVYTQAVLEGTHTPELDISLREVEIELYELLNQLYKQHRLKDYMKYEALVSKQMIVYSLLKQLFGYSQPVVGNQ